MRTRLNPSLAPLQDEIRARAGPAAAGALAAGGPAAGDSANRALTAGDPATHVPAAGDPAARVPSRATMETALTAGPFVIGAMAA